VLVLASRSPRRRAILEQLGIPFRAVAPDVEELEEGPPAELVVENALRKARAVEGDPVLGVDTEVVIGGRVYGKPRDACEARAILHRLAGRAHEVMSGVALRAGGGERTALAVTRVRFRELDEATVDWYLGQDEWADAAGGYQIQGRGAALVEGIEGDYLNVVGLPVATLLALAPGLLDL
jgi:septum formation protein